MEAGYHCSRSSDPYPESRGDPYYRYISHERYGDYLPPPPPPHPPGPPSHLHYHHPPYSYGGPDYPSEFRGYNYDYDSPYKPYSSHHPYPHPQHSAPPGPAKTPFPSRYSVNRNRYPDEPDSDLVLPPNNVDNEYELPSQGNGPRPPHVLHVPHVPPHPLHGPPPPPLPPGPPHRHHPHGYIANDYPDYYEHPHIQPVSLYPNHKHGEEAPVPPPNL